MTALGPLEWIKLAIYYASYLYFIAAPVLIWLVIARRGGTRLLAALFLVGASLLAYARFVEPRFLLANEHDVMLPGCFDRAGALRVAVFSDIHNGLFDNAIGAGRIVRRVNETRPDIVMIAGDFVYFLHPDRFAQAYAAFEEIDAPVFAVLGNHDHGIPGPDLSGPLKGALPTFGLRMIDDQALRLSNSRFAIELVGLSDQWVERQRLSLLEKPTSAPRLVLTHNPATMRDIQPDMHADLLIGGHTHGGQIMLPFVTCSVAGVCGAVAYGLRRQKDTLIFTTSGTGMVGLPMRFRVPPRVDVLNIRYARCVVN